MWLVFVCVILLVTVTLMIASTVIWRRYRPAVPALVPQPAPWEKEGGLDLTMPTGGPAAIVEPPQGARLRPAAPSFGVAPQLLDDVAKGLAKIPPFPQAVLRIMAELDSTGSSARSVADILATEPVLTACLLRTANSAGTGLRRDIVTVADAVAYLGFSTVKALLLRLQLGQMFRDAGGGYDSQNLWVHSMAVAQAAEELAIRSGRADPQLALTAGLLHDIGKVAINSQFPDTVRELWSDNHPADESFLAREHRLFGADHAFIGGYLASNWKLPEPLIQMIRLHHLPREIPLNLTVESRRALFAVYIANQLVKLRYVYCADMEIDIIPAAVMTDLGLPMETERLLDARMMAIISRAASLGAETSDPRPRQNAA
ncbi:MAG TPA: HDOD domain-containing protein [Tepidisphaeraceae bacterium]|nr:HDOD domain-containing protein [Tepidisphaeraceae bacterium]